MILLTRPAKDSLEIAKILGKQDCIIEPMLEIEQVAFKIPKAHQAVISTSKNVNYQTDIKIPEHGKNAAEILKYCENNLSREAGKIIYLSGDELTLDIAEKLREQGFEAERIIAYKQIRARKLNVDLSEISIAVFYSLNSLRNFKNLSADNKLNHISCVCISEKVAELALKMSWKKIHIAAQTNSRSMIAQIQQASLE